MLSSTFRRRAVNLRNLRYCQNINILSKYSSESTTHSLEDELKLDYLDGERKGKIEFAAFVLQSYEIIVSLYFGCFSSCGKITVFRN